jgi:cysteine desulfurase
MVGYELINKKHSLDNFIVICYNNIDAERLVFLLEEKKVYVATGAACAASKGVRSHVLAAIGLTESQIAGSLRISLGETNNEEQLHEAAKIINSVVEAERTRVQGSI